MELAIIAGLGALGWRMSAKGTAPRRLQEVPNVARAGVEFPFDPQVETSALLDADMQAAREHVMRVYDPATGTYRWQTDKVGAGAFDGPRPTVRSDKTAIFASQRNLETYTGADDTWQHKSERAGLFEPSELKVAVGSGGTAKSRKDLFDRQELVDRNVFGSRMNNVLPFAQDRVGPGLGVDPNVPSSDGLHSQFRVLPTESLNAYRTNQLPGRTASGAAQITNGGRRPEHFQQNKPSLVDRAPQIGAARTSFNAPSAFPVPDLKATRSDGTSREFRGPGYANAGATVSAGETHVQKAKYALGNLNVMRSQVMDGGTVRDVTLRDVKKRLPHAGVTGAGSVTARAGQSATAFVMREQARECGPGVPVVGGGSVVGTGSARSAAESSINGLRETEAINAGQYSTIHKNAIRKTVSLGVGRETAGRTEYGRLAGGVMGTAGRVQKRRVQNAFGIPQHGTVPHAQQRTDPGRETPKKKLSSEEPRELGLGLKFKTMRDASRPVRQIHDACA
jgi:hypothetical protein